jgi:hypothetical protein
MTDFGSLRLKGEGESIIYDDPISGPQQTYTPVRFGLGYKITDEMTKNDLYGQTSRLEKKPDQVGRRSPGSHRGLPPQQRLRHHGADGFKATGFDGLQLCSTAHTRLDGGATQRNRPSSDVDVSPPPCRTC